MRRGQKTSAEQVVLTLRQIEVQTTQGKSLALACKVAEISDLRATATRAGLSTQVRLVSATTGPTSSAVINRRQTGSVRTCSSGILCSLAS
ncbi:hypothetical protein AX289_06970 [Methylorubrum populi]|nr:hypothetical protein AX289_06970 [Methylorubrum populi]